MSASSHSLPHFRVVRTAGFVAYGLSMEVPTVAEVIKLPVLANGGPRVLAGQDALDKPVRWVHVSELADIASLLHGGELILTTGIALPSTAAGLRRYVRELHAAQVSGLVIELGRRYNRIPRSLVDEAAILRLPVVSLSRPVEFVQVTETVHALILNAQHELLRFSESAHATFTKLNVEGASLQEILDRASEMSGRPVVLEDLIHRPLAFNSAQVDMVNLLRDWEARSRRRSREAGDATWLTTMVGPRQQRWGRLVMPLSEQPSRQTRIRLEMLLCRAAEALALNRLVERDNAGLEQQAHRRLLSEMVSRKAVDERELLVLAEALGLSPMHGFMGMAVTIAEFDQLDPLAAQDRDQALSFAVATAARVSGLQALVSTLAPNQVLALASVPRSTEINAFVNAFATQLQIRLPGVIGTDAFGVGIGPVVDRIVDAPASLAEAEQVSLITLRLDPQRRRAFHRATDVRLRGVLVALRHEPKLLAFAEAELGRLLAYDSQHRTDLVEVLRQYLDVGGNKAELSRVSHRSRPALYAKLAEIERVLGVRLDDPESRVSLHVAMLMHWVATELRQNGAEPTGV